MSHACLVRLEHVSKRFKLYSSAAQRLADWLRLPPAQRIQDFYALRDVSFEVQRGECLGIIGPNGAGKSTLLKLLTGVLQPTAGRLEVAGRVLSLLELGTGFAPDLTGQQNIEHSARLLGFPRGYATDRLEAIRTFADIGDYFDRPVKFYSSGMLVRLAFALFSTMQPELFLVDEALAVGDQRFAARAVGRIRSMLEAGTTLLFVSHDLQLINELCTRAIWLHAGTLQMDGAPAKVTRAYQRFVVRGGPATTPPSTDETLAWADRRLDLGSGWYPVEAYAGEIFRWAAEEAELVVQDSNTPELLLELDVLPGANNEPAHVEAIDATGNALAVFALSGRSIVSVPMPQTELPRHVFLRSDARPQSSNDGRSLTFRLMRWGWADYPDLLPASEAGDWVAPRHDLDLESEVAAMQRAIRNAPTRSRSALRIVRVSTRSPAGVEAVRFASHEPFELDVCVAGSRGAMTPVVDVEVRDAFDRLLWSSRSTWRATPQAGEEMTLSLSTQDLRLGRGLYQVSVALPASGNEDGVVVQRVDAVWKFEVIEAIDSSFKGMFDLGWDYQPAPLRGDDAVPTLSRI